MDLFCLIVDYLYDYIFTPIYNIFEDKFNQVNPLNSWFYIYDGKLNFYYQCQDIGHHNILWIPIYNPSGEISHYVQGFNTIDFLVFLTTIVIFILLFIVCVKFIVWLFKQISFITRF